MSKILPILKTPSPLLRRKSGEIKKEKILEKKFQNFCSDMTKTMKEKDGVGLAAPQVGEDIRLIVINEKNGPLCMINPKIIKKSLLKEWDEEGCLSVPGIYGKVKRNKNLSCEYLDKEGKKNKIKANGLLARVIQHEIDHLDGILFIDKAKDIHEIERL